MSGCFDFDGSGFLARVGFLAVGSCGRLTRAAVLAAIGRLLLSLLQLLSLESPSWFQIDSILHVGRQL